MVDGIAGVDETNGLVYFTGTLDGPTERHLYVVSLDGGEPRRITAAPGMHTVVTDHALRRFVDIHHAADTPPTVTLRSARGRRGSPHDLSKDGPAYRPARARSRRNS